MKTDLYQAEILQRYGVLCAPLMEDRNYDILETRSMVKAASLVESMIVHITKDGKSLHTLKVSHSAKAVKE